jgi:hypothetical protein
METYIHTNYKFPSHLKWWLAALDAIELPTAHRASTKRYGDWFSDAESKEVEALSIFANEDRGNGAPNATVFETLTRISDLPNLKFLDIPADAVAYVSGNAILPKLEYLRISAPRTTAIVEQGLNKQLDFLENAFPNLRSLYLYFPPICYRNFDVQRFPQLQWFEVDLDLDKAAKSLKIFHCLPLMQGFGLNGVHKKDILGGLSQSLTALEFWNVRTRALDLSYLAQYRDLQYLTINARAVLNARMLATLPCLRELQLWNLQRFEDIESLLDSRSLDRLSLRYLREDSVSDDLRRTLKSRLSYVEFE